MEALVGLGGVLMGFVLGFWATRQRERAEAKGAAALILGELSLNKIRLNSINSGKDFDTMARLRRDAWDTHGIVLLRILRGGPLTDVYGAYASLDILEYTRDWLQAEYDRALLAIEDAKRTGDIQTKSQGEWLGMKGVRAQRAEKGLDDLAEMVPDKYIGDVDRAIAALSQYRPFED